MTDSKHHSLDYRMETDTSSVNPNLAYAVKFVHATCCLAGLPSYVDDIRADLRDYGLVRAVKDHDTAVLFEWLVEALSYQGISDAIASDYMAQHGNARWSDIAAALDQDPSCPKLGGYWRFYDCRYQKWSGTCSEPGHIAGCPLPRHPLRNGRLNQMAYSLFLFMRDVADGDFVGWIDQQLSAVKSKGPDRLALLREAIIGPLRNVYGVSDKVLAMALSHLLMGADGQRALWREVGGTFVAVDTLVHNFLHRTGILQRFSADHPYGPSATGQEGVPQSSGLSLATSMPGNSTEHSLQHSPGSYRPRSGGTAPRMACTCATATGSMTGPVAATRIVSCFDSVIASFCTRKSMKIT